MDLSVSQLVDRSNALPYLPLGYVHIDTSPSLGLRLQVVCQSYKLHPHEWSVRGHLYKHITQRVPIDYLL